MVLTLQVRGGDGALRRRAGGYTTRQPATWSHGTFSHTTIAGPLNENPAKRPPMKHAYMRGFAVACGSDEDEVARWIAAYRRIYEGCAPSALVSAVDGGAGLGT
ncbi:hypothetical protein [Actinomadura macrotermitis]|uniref:hypothetical protein n=1 Tax=Actinomadura macrotermitis TaxID=2585200 RepID=UPI001295F562|nr:hypothetical protein [Actinomadura macrotermitis]